MVMKVHALWIFFEGERMHSQQICCQCCERDDIRVFKTLVLSQSALITSQPFLQPALYPSCSVNLEAAC